MNERTITRAERYEQEHPLVERIGRLEIRKNQRTWKFEVSLGVCLWSICVDGLAEARDWAVKANSLMDAGFELYGFHGVCVFDYEKLMKWAETAHPSQRRKYWMYI